MTSSATRRQRRYTLVNPELVQAEILPFDPSEVTGVPAELREISQTEVKLLLPGLPELQLECRILLKSHRFTSPLVLDAEVFWARPNPAGDWLLGCRLPTPLSDEKIEELIESGVLNRRSSVRQRSQIPVSAQLEADSPKLKAVVSDFSEGGLCLTIAEAPHNTRHVCVFGSVAGEEARIPLKIRWTVAIGPNRLIGCEFMHKADYQTLRKMHLAAQKKPTDDRSHIAARPNRTRLSGLEAMLQSIGCKSTEALLSAVEELR